jgi:hypothetical protein
MSPPNQPAPESPIGEIPNLLRFLIGTPLVALGGFVTAFFSFILCAYIAGRIGGEHPMSDMTRVTAFWLIFGAVPLASRILLLRVAPSKKRFWWRVLLVVLLLFLVVDADGNWGPNNWHQMFRREKFLETDASSLKHTIVSPYLESDIVKGTNLLWCGTFQLAWNEACRVTGGDLQFERDHRMISALNKHSFTREFLDESSYVVMSGFVKDNIQDKIRKAVNEKFHGTFKPQYIPDKAFTSRPQDFVAYACLYKNLSFPMPFERIDETLAFGGIQIPAFGMGHYKASLEKMYPQVLILDYQSEEDFVIELKTTSVGDRLILAKLQPKTNLGDTVMAVETRIRQSQGEMASTNDLLLVPRMKLDLTREYSEIEKLRLVPKGPNVAKDLMLISAVQNTAFEMSGKGVELKSEAHMAFACAKQQEPVPKHRMIFDKPFLILMQRSDAKIPYFAFWIDNPEVLASWR